MFSLVITGAAPRPGPDCVHKHDNMGFLDITRTIVYVSEGNFISSVQMLDMNPGNLVL